MPETKITIKIKPEPKPPEEKPRGPFDPPKPASPWHKEQRERTGF
jgi:hypothetical protein